ncbi:hypothetical protein CYY_007436 [Polysphondylium violaceum]|uniref:Methyltransferase type 12 domain-containing protein n=1 Tax=Polysphondylium violaceum TaxID=133409 RepID=A0A8J4PRW7_9MYCE|nr:hypothetical protein CYY_007436 [Polysphondylium violaceum]
MSLSDQLKEQQIYYNKRATEYDKWWFRQDQFDQGDYLKQEDSFNKTAIYEYLAKITSHPCIPQNDDNSKLKLLECASGTGNFTQWFLKEKRFDIRCEEGSNEMIQVLQGKYHDLISQNQFSIHQTDLFSDSFNPLPDCYDVVFLGFFISHIPPSLFQSFFEKCRKALKVGGKIIFVESYYTSRYQTKTHEQKVNNVDLDEKKSDQDYFIKRNLINGESYSIVKIGFTSESIITTFHQNGFVLEKGDTISVNGSFIYGSFTRNQ